MTPLTETHVVDVEVQKPNGLKLKGKPVLQSKICSKYGQMLPNVCCTALHSQQLSSTNDSLSC